MQLPVGFTFFSLFALKGFIFYFLTLVAYCYRVQKEAKLKEKELVKEMEKNKREIEKEKKRMDRELQKEKWQSVGAFFQCS